MSNRTQSRAREMESRYNFQKVREVFKNEADRRGLKGAFGVAPFKRVYNDLLPVQQKLLKEISGKRFASLMEVGSVICIAFAFSENAIEAIGVKKNDVYDIERWNFYAEEYTRLNHALNETADRLAAEINGIALQATIMNRAYEIRHVEDYYAMAVSHRVIAEQTGVGWRGKNELVVNPQFSCAIRLVSIITDISIEKTSPILNSCNGCSACLDACPFLRSKDSIENYREQCKRYISSLSLHSDVCGKCIKACYFESIHRDQFSL